MLHVVTEETPKINLIESQQNDLKADYSFSRIICLFSGKHLESEGNRNKGNRLFFPSKKRFSTLEKHRTLKAV